MKRTIKALICMLLIASLSVPLALFVDADDYYMAYNFYGNPDLSSTSGKFDSFMIDFRGTITPNNTYWSLCNFGMYLGSSQTTATYPGIRGYGAYCGLQNRQVSQGKAGILSFWEATYHAPGSTYDSTVGAYMLNGQKVLVNASRVYPEGSSTFTGEGDGTNCIAPYAWESNKWYTMLLHSWTDEETGTTFVGEWFRNVETGEWTLFSYFDTHLYDSYLIGGMSQFQENYWQYGEFNYRAVRECNLKNMYAYDHNQNVWKSLNSSTLSYGDGGGNNKKGAHSFGMSSDAGGQFWWGSTGGEVADQEAYEAAATVSTKYTIKQPASPVFGCGNPIEASIVDVNGSRVICWNVPSDNSPQLGYVVKVYNEDENLVATYSATRPEISEIDISDLEDTSIRCEVTVNTVFGDSYTASVMSEEYARITGVEFVLSSQPASNLNKTIDVSIDMISEGKDVYGFSLEVNFDADKLSFDSGVFGEKFPWARAVLYDEGKVRVFAATNVNAPADGTERMVDLTFRIIDPDKAPGSSYSFSVDFYNGQPAYTLDEEYNTVNLTKTIVNDLTVTLGYHPYDLDNSGSVIVGDVTMILNAIAGHGFGIAAGKNLDFDGDGDVTVTDVTVLLNFLATYSNS